MISVIVPSYNGARTLPRTLEALGRLTLPDRAVEFILVDNDSSDETSEILAREGKQLEATVLKEPRRGKSYALNTAVAVAKGDLLVFADDDVIPATDWLLAYVDAAHRYPAAAFSPGRSATSGTRSRRSGYNTSVRLAGPTEAPRSTFRKAPCPTRLPRVRTS